MRHTSLFLFFLAPAVVFSQQPYLGKWLQDKDGLPCFQYNGMLPFKAVMKNGEKAKLPDDPWFLLGNYRFTVFTHVSGVYQLITVERAWGRVNQIALVQLIYQEKSLVVMVEDNGEGIRKTEMKEGIGLRSIRLRAEYIRAQFKIESDDKGTLIILEVPYENIS